jgi:purine-binding chemotaxis protein CheW
MLSETALGDAVRPNPTDNSSAKAVDPAESAWRTNRSHVFGTFLVDDTEFAVAIRNIKEVVNVPADFTRVSPAPDYFRGVFSLRGFVVPVIDLRRLLGLPPDVKDWENSKVAIIEHDGSCFGLLVDATGDVFTVTHSQHHPFSYNSSDVVMSVVSGVFLRDEGRTTVQILDPQKLLNCAQFPRVEASLALAPSEKRLGKRRQCLSFFIGDCAYAFDITCIREVVDFRGIENPTVASRWTLGTIDLRGTTVPVVDLRAFLNDAESFLKVDFVGKGFKLVVLTIGDELVSFLVDKIKTIVPFHDDDIVQFPPVGLRRGALLRGGLTMQDETILLLIDHETMMIDPTLLHVSTGLAKVFREHAASERASNTRHSKKTTYITFSIDREYALDIRQVNEVLNFPDNITFPPNSQPFIEGLVNLRGDLIPIINPRRLYNLEPVERSLTRLMILTCDGAKYGFMVDKVGSIVNVAVSDAKPMAPFLGRQQGDQIVSDVKEWLFMTGANASSEALSILDLSKVLLRSELSRCL